MENQTQPQVTFTFSDITLDEANAILAALQELPAKICNPISAKIKTQAEAQIALLQPPAPADTGEAA